MNLPPVFVARLWETFKVSAMADIPDGYVFLINRILEERREELTSFFLAQPDHETTTRKIRELVQIAVGEAAKLHRSKP
jgi:hypothetical protein